MAAKTAIGGPEDWGRAARLLAALAAFAKFMAWLAEQ